MNQLLKLRKYQEEAIDTIENAWAEEINRPAVVLATGLGKTVIFSHLIAMNVQDHRRALVLVHRDELAKQARDKILSVAPDLDVGVVKAEQNETDAQVIVASVQTLALENRRQQIDPRSVHMVVVDECHHATSRTWTEVMSYLGCYNTTPTVGFTATMARSDGQGLGRIWQDVVFKRDVMWGIINGYLTDVRAHSIEVDGLDLSQVARARGDFQDGSLAEALESCGAGPVIAKAYKEHAGNRQGILVSPTKSTARSFCDDFNDEGIVTETILSETSTDERAAIYQRFQERKTQVLSSVGVLTEGFDMPQAEVAMIARPTSSQPLFQQIVGRVLRTFPGKEEALILDVVGATKGVSLCSVVDLSENQVEVREGKSLHEMFEIDYYEDQNLVRDVVSGTVTSKVAKLFDASSSVWLQTELGTWFIPTKEGYVFLWPEESGMFKVGKTGTQFSMKGGYWLKEDPTELNYAMAWGEMLAEELDASVANRSASWRKKKEKPSEKQVNHAKRLGIKVTSAMKKDKVSDLISKYYASKILDKAR